MRQTLPRAAGGLRCAPWRKPSEGWAGRAEAGRTESHPGGGGTNVTCNPRDPPPRRAWLSQWGRSSKYRKRRRGNEASATERAWSRVEGLLSPECQGGGAACEWRVNRMLVVAREAREGEELGTSGRDGE